MNVYAFISGHVFGVSALKVRVLLYAYTCSGKLLRERDTIAKLSVEIRSMEGWREVKRVG
jgi:hypothetical protein